MVQCLSRYDATPIAGKESSQPVAEFRAIARAPRGWVFDLAASILFGTNRLDGVRKDVKNCNWKQAVANLLQFDIIITTAVQCVGALKEPQKPRGCLS